MNAINIARDLIKVSEGLKLKAYKPTPNDPWTIGYGATGPDIKEGTVWTVAQSDSDLERRLKIIQTMILGAMKVSLNDSQLAALIDFVYNLGFNAFFGSSLRRRINDKDPKASDEFLRWVHDDGKVLPGLVIRRQSERQLFIKS